MRVNIGLKCVGTCPFQQTARFQEPLQTEDRTSHKGTTVAADDASHAGVVEAYVTQLKGQPQMQVPLTALLFSLLMSL